MLFPAHVSLDPPLFLQSLDFSSLSAISFKIVIYSAEVSLSHLFSTFVQIALPCVRAPYEFVAEYFKLGSAKLTNFPESGSFKVSLKESRHCSPGLLDMQPEIRMTAKRNGVLFRMVLNISFILIFTVLLKSKILALISSRIEPQTKFSRYLISN